MDNTHHRSLGPMHGVRASRKVALWRLLMRKIPGQECVYGQSSSASVLMGRHGWRCDKQKCSSWKQRAVAKGESSQCYYLPITTF